MRSIRNSFIFTPCVAALLVALAVVMPHWTRVGAAGATSTRFPEFGYIEDNPVISITTATATSSVTSVSGVTTAHIEFNFATVAGSYGTCTVQPKTSFDGTNFLTLGSAASVTVSSNTVNVFDVYAQAPTTSVTTTPSSSAATGFGKVIEYTFACSGSYGTSAPVTITAIYK